MTINKFDTIKKSFPEILKKSMGIVSTACEKAGIHRSTYYNWRNSDKEFAIECDDVSEYAGDFVESQLLNNIKAGDTSCIIFYCKTKLKNRGYIERTETTGKDGGPLSQVNYTAEIAKARIKDLIEGK